MDKTFIISASAALLLAGAALTAKSVRAGRADSLTENNIEALGEEEYNCILFPRCCTFPTAMQGASIIDCLTCEEALNRTGENDKRCIAH